MRRFLSYTILLLLTVEFLSACRTKEQPLDVFYLVSTNVLSAQDEHGGTLWCSTLCDADRAAMDKEAEWVKKNMFDGRFNVSAPYYHQYTFDAICELSADSFQLVYDGVVKEVCGLFDEYMAGRDNTRPFILAGFSQGAMLTLELLRHMTDEQYNNMVACYSIGYRLTESDIAHPHIKQAENATGKGVVVSFNSTLSTDAIWPLVNENACTCINPVNWQTDSTEAEFEYNGIKHSVHVDPSYNVLIVKSDSNKYYRDWMDKVGIFAKAGVSHSNLHHWDLQFYAPNIRDNALNRLKANR